MIWIAQARCCLANIALKGFPAKARWLISPAQLQPKVNRQILRRFETNVAKDVILFKYENPRFFKYLNIFAIVQFLLWSFIGKFTVSTMRDVPVDESINTELPWWRKINLGEGKYKNSLALMSYFFGASILACSWVFTLRSVRFLILNKGGKSISLVTYAPMGENRIMAVPIDKVSCVLSRTSAGSTLPLRVYGKRFSYLLDMRGEFRNPQLFDRTAGLKRKLQ